MVLATKLKNIKPVTKLLCTILAMIFAFGSLFCAIDVELIYSCFESVSAITTNDPSERFDVSKMPRFRSYISDNAYLLKSAYSFRMTDDVKAFLEKNRSDYIKEGLNEFNNQKLDNADYADECNFYFDYSVDYKNNTITIGNYEFGDGPLLNSSEKQVEAYLNSLYDSFMTKEFYCDNVSFGDVYDGFHYYIKDNKTKEVYTNFIKGDTIKNITKHDYYYAFSDGKMTCSDYLSRAFDASSLCSNSDNMDYYFYIDTTYGQPYHLFEMYDTFAHKNALFKLSMSIILAVLFVALSLFVIIASGKRNEDGKVKRAFVDYIPFGLHTALSGGAITGLVMLFAVVLDGASPYGFEVAQYQVIRFVAPLVGCAIGLVFIEWITSIIRNARSNTPFYKTLLSYWLAYGFNKLVILNIKKLFSKLKKLLGYTPANFKKRIKLFLIGYGVLNLLLLLFQIVWSLAGFDSHFCIGLAIINALVFVGINIASVVFVTKYVVNLDKIITAAHNHTTPNVNYNVLPNSLKLLVDSINISRQELQQAVSKAVKDERMRTELITNVSHDLRTPLTSVINYVDLLKQCDITDENALEYIGVLEEKGNRLKRLIDDLIEASKLTSGVITLDMVSLNLSELATQAVVEHQKDFEDNNLTLVFKGDKNNIMAFSDGAKTYRVIENLLSNARKYSAKGTRVYADVYTEGNNAVFEIKNVSSQPLDITPDELIERFVRGDSSRNTQGNGLGLSIADNLCSAMGGKLNISIDGDLFKAKVILNSHE